MEDVYNKIEGQLKTLSLWTEVSHLVCHSQESIPSGQCTVFCALFQEEQKEIWKTILVALSRFFPEVLGLPPWLLGL